MLTDRYDNPVSTSSSQARDLYVDALDRLLSGDREIESTFVAASQADPDFALAHCGLARIRQILGNVSGAREAMAAAKSSKASLSEREQAHVKAMDLLTSGKVPDGYKLIREHLHQFPRDAMLAQTCTSVFGLIGFSGLPGREAETLAYTESLLPHYGEDWWFLCQHAFSLVETGQIKPAVDFIERSLALQPRNAHAAHIRAHVYYESGEVLAGASYLNEWMPDFSREAVMHCHMAWHQALWALEQQDTERMWQIIDESVMPGAAWGPPLNVLTDCASILFRAELAGESVPEKYWQGLSDYAQQFFPKPGLAFADVHAAIAHAGAGNEQALQTIAKDARGPAGDVVSQLSNAFSAFAAQDWPAANRHLIEAMADHARIGGSRAQRDLLEFALLTTLLRQGQTAQARQMLLLRRPVHKVSCPVQGLH